MDTINVGVISRRLPSNDRCQTTSVWLITISACDTQEVDRRDPELSIAELR